MTETMHGIQPVMEPAAARTGATARIVAIRAVPAADQRSTTITGLRQRAEHAAVSGPPTSPRSSKR